MIDGYVPKVLWGIGLIYISYVCMYVHMLVLNCEILNNVHLVFRSLLFFFFVVCVCYSNFRISISYIIYSFVYVLYTYYYLLHHYWDCDRKSQIRTEQSSPAEARKCSKPGRGHQDTQFTSLTPWASSMEAMRLDTTASPSVWFFEGKEGKKE